MSKRAPGLCFPRAVDFLVAGPGDMELVHGLVRHPELGYRHVHAWCELKDQVIDNSLRRKLMLSRIQYYLIGSITYIKRYNMDEALELMDEAGHYGPWDELLNAYQYLALQRNAKGRSWVISRQSQLDRKYIEQLANLGELELMNLANDTLRESIWSNTLG